MGEKIRYHNNVHRRKGGDSNRWRAPARVGERKAKGYHAAIAMLGAGESAILVGSGVRSPSPRLLFSLGTVLPVWLALLSLSPFSVTTTPSLASPLGMSVFRGLGARQVGTSHMMPVKLFNWKDLRCHLRHGAPVRSRARRPALMAPWLAFGPSLCAEGMSLAVSTEPSSLKSV